MFLQVSTGSCINRLGSPRSKHASGSSLRVREPRPMLSNGVIRSFGTTNGLLIQASNGRSFFERRNTEQNFMRRSMRSARTGRESISPQIAKNPAKMIGGEHNIAPPSSAAAMAIVNV